MKKFIVLLLVLGFSLANASVVRADTLGVDFGAGTYLVGTNGQSYTLGYEFNLSQSATLTGLGFWDEGDGHGFTQVGLWDTSGNQLAYVDTTANAGT